MLWRLIKPGRRDREFLLGTGTCFFIKGDQRSLTVGIPLQLYGPAIINSLETDMCLAWLRNSRAASVVEEGHKMKQRGLGLEGKSAR